MALHDWQCPVHGDFEGSHPICPALGCLSEDVIKVYRKAPSIGTARTRRVDRTLRGLAEAHGLSDMSNRDGQSVAGSSDRMLWGSQADTLLPVALRGQNLFAAAKTPTIMGEDTNGIRTTHGQTGALMNLSQRARARMDQHEIPRDDNQIREAVKSQL